MEKLKITVGGKEFYAKLLQDKAPKTIAQMKEYGPIHTVMHAAKVVNEEVMCPAPYFYEAKENPVFDQDPGNVVLLCTKAYDRDLLWRRNPGSRLSGTLRKSKKTHCRASKKLLVQPGRNWDNRSRLK